MRRPSSAVVRKIKLLQILRKIKPHERSLLIQHLDNDAIEIISEFVFNCIKTDFRLSKRKKNALKSKLHSSKKELACIADKSCDLKKRKGLIVKQSGQGLGILLGTLVPVIANLIASKL